MCPDEQTFEERAYVFPKQKIRQRFRRAVCRHRWSAWGENVMRENFPAEMRFRCCQKCTEFQTGATLPSWKGAKPQ